VKYAASMILHICAVTFAFAQTPLLGEDTVQVSPHVWAIMGFPNIGIVVGSKGTLVVDTGLGPRNGATAARVALKFAPGNRLYLTTTHFHPEHAAGVAGFPPGTVLIRDAVQQDEMDAHGEEMIARFSSGNAEFKELLSDATLRKPDLLFPDKYLLDLGGGVKVRLLWFGGAHTKGDELVFVDPDKTLISGDVVQNKVVPNIAGGATPKSWIDVLDKIRPLGAVHVLPDHSNPGDGSLVLEERKFITEVRDRAIDLKRHGVSADAAGQAVTEEFQVKYPDWHIKSVAGFVERVYAE
jgi:glyoxylase-like metal-dependent hydrolase (beta-lactamase superfamily II)